MQGVQFWTPFLCFVSPLDTSSKGSLELVFQNRPSPSLTQKPGGSVVKSLLPVQKMKVRFLGQEETWRRKLHHPPVFLLVKSMDRGAW